MEGFEILALALILPVILLPAVFIWYLNFSGIWAAWKESKAREERREKARKETTA